LTLLENFKRNPVLLWAHQIRQTSTSQSCQKSVELAIMISKYPCSCSL